MTCGVLLTSSHTAGDCASRCRVVRTPERQSRVTAIGTAIREMAQAQTTGLAVNRGEQTVQNQPINHRSKERGKCESAIGLHRV